MPRSAARPSSRRAYVDDGYGHRFERPPPSYREGRPREYDSIPGSKRPYGALVSELFSLPLVPHFIYSCILGQVLIVFVYLVHFRMMFIPIMLSQCCANHVLVWSMNPVVVLPSMGILIVRGTVLS